MLLGGGSVSLVAVPCLWHLGVSPARGKPWIWMGTSICFGDYHLVMTNIAMDKPWPIEIDGLPFLKMVDLSMAMLNNQMVL
jgi:hypothetical protein